MDLPATADITTTMAGRADRTITVPTWVGTLSVFSNAFISAPWSSTQQINYMIEIGGSTTSLQGYDVVSGRNIVIMHTEHRTLTSPGSTVKVELFTQAVTSTETDAGHYVNYTAMGMR